MAGRGVFRRPWWQPPRPRYVLEKTSSSGLEAHSAGGLLTTTPSLGGYAVGWRRGGSDLSLTPDLGGVATGGDSLTVSSPPPPTYRGIVSAVNYSVKVTLGPNSVWVITPDVRAISIDRKLNVFPGAVQGSTADVLLDDAGGIYSPLVNSYHGGYLRPNTRIDIQATYTDPATGGTASYYLFRGLIDAFSVNPSLEQRTVTLQCRDYWKYLQTREVTTSMMVGWQVNSILANVLDTASIDTSQRSIDTITDILPFAWFQGRVLHTVMGEFIEAAGYAAYVAADGTLRIRDRYFDLGGEAVASYSELFSLSFTYDDDPIINRVTLRGSPRSYVNSTQVVAQLAEAISIPASGTATFFLSYEDPRNQEGAPAIEMVTPVSSTDILINANSGGSGTDRTSTASWSVYFFGESAKLTIFNGNGNVNWLTKCRLRGKPIVRLPNIAVRYDVDSSQTVYGLRDSTIETNLFTTRDLLDRRAGDIAEIFAGPSPRAALATTDDLPGGLALDLANVINVTNSHSGLADEQFTVMGIAHELQADDVGWVHRITLDLQRARGYGVFILDTDQVDIDRLSR